MEIELSGKKYIFKDEISGREEHLSGILKFLTNMLNNDKIEKSDLTKMLTDDNFNEATIKLVSFMSLEPKMDKDAILDLPSSNVMNLKLSCLFKYAESLQKISEFTEKKKLMTQSALSTDSSISSLTKPIDQQIRSNLAKK